MAWVRSAPPPVPASVLEVLNIKVKEQIPEDGSCRAGRGSVWVCWLGLVELLDQFGFDGIRLEFLLSLVEFLVGK